MDTQKLDKPKKGRRKRKRLGEFLVDAGLIDDKALSKALEIQNITRKKLAQVLLGMGAVDEHEIAETLSKQFNIPLIPMNYPAASCEVSRNQNNSNCSSCL